MNPPRTISKAQREARRLGLGDMVAVVATPIARILKLPCVDPVTKKLRPESPCAKRKEALNNLTSKPNV